MRGTIATRSRLVIRIVVGVLACGASIHAGESKVFEYNSDGGVERGNYVLGTKLHPIPEIEKPARLKAVMDPTFNTRITRVTDKETGRDGKTWPFIKNEYAKATPENCDGSYVILTMKEYYWRLYQAKSWKIMRHLCKYDGGGIEPGPIEPRWDHKDPNVFYYRQGSTLYCYRVKEDRSEVVYDFSMHITGTNERAGRITTHTEGTPSYDCRYWAFMVERGDAGMLCFDRVEKQVIGKMMEAPGDSISMSPSGKWVLTARGTTRYKTDFTEPVNLCPYGRMNHGDLAIDAKGNEVFVHQCKDDWITMYDMKTGKRTRLISMIHDSTWQDYCWKNEHGERAISSFHISGNCYATPGWVLISTSGGAGREARNWQAKSLYMLELKERPRIWRIAHTHCISRKYVETVFASINTRGNRIYFGSNWDVPGDPVETYVVDLPVGWYQDLMGKQAAGDLRRKAAELLGTTVEELVGVN